MSATQRWKPRKATTRYWSEGMTFDADGAFITYAHHERVVAELREAHEKALNAARSEERAEGYAIGCDDGYRAGVADSKPRTLTDDEPLIERCLALMGCDKDCTSRDEERAMMLRVVDLVRAESRTSGPGINHAHGITLIHDSGKPPRDERGQR